MGGGVAICAFAASANAQIVTNTSGNQILYHKANSYGTLVVFSTTNKEHPEFQYVNRSGTIVLQNLPSGNGVEVTLPGGGYSIQLMSQGQAILSAHGLLVANCAGLNQRPKPIPGRPPLQRRLGGQTNTFTGVITYSKSGGIAASSQTRALLGCLANHTQLAQNLNNFYAAQGVSLNQVAQCLADGSINCTNPSGEKSSVEPEGWFGCLEAAAMFAAAAAALASSAADGPIGFVLATVAYAYAYREMVEQC